MRLNENDYLMLNELCSNKDYAVMALAMMAGISPNLPAAEFELKYGVYKTRVKLVAVVEYPVAPVKINLLTIKTKSSLRGIHNWMTKIRRLKGFI